MSDQSGSWQPDPFGRHQYRYWNGSEWTDQVSNDGVVSSDPATADGAAAAGEGAGAGAVPTEPEPTAATPGWGAPPPDATTSMPAAEPSPFPPPAFAATATQATPPKGSSNRLPLVLGGIALLALLGVGAFLLFGGDDDDEPSRADLIAAFGDDLGLSGDEAECVVDALGEDRAADLVDDPDGASEADRDAFNAAVEECRGGETSDTTATTEDTTDTTEDTTDGTVNDFILESFMQGLMSTGDLTEEQARCVGEEFLSIEGLDLNEIADDPNAMFADPEMMSRLLTIFSDCGIDPTQLGGGGGTPSGLLEGDTYGDNPTLDALWDACEAGDGAACDELYFSSGVGTEYEEFGDTCGGRREAGTVLCANEDLG